MRIPPVFRLASSLLALGGGLVLLVGDSASDACVEGFKAVRYEATFSSTCATGSTVGRLSVNVAESDRKATSGAGEDDYNSAFAAALEAAGLPPVEGSVQTSTNSEKVCAARSVTFRVTMADRSERECQGLELAAPSSEVVCTPAAVVPVVRTSEFGDGGAADGGAMDRCTITFTRVSP